MTHLLSHRGPDDDGVRRLVFGGVPVGSDKKTGKPRPQPAAPREDLATLVEAFARRAFRRPVEPAQVAPVVAMVHEMFEDGEGFEAALRAGYRAILCSPRFLHLTEEPGPLDDHALATRLALFLRNSTPDPELRSVADRGELRQPDVLLHQAGRLLRGQVHHAPYLLQPAEVLAWSEAPVAWDGFPVTHRPPDLAHASPGVAIEAFALVPAHA